ncbi:MAG: rhodanese-like domain-containing protein [Proteobacteria bacterium]|nr:rhodanese-like domain-containing protein [Pseudomonadota bacterium]
MSKNMETISALEAQKMCQHEPSTLLIDVRSSMEFLFVGHPTGAVHIPWIDEPDWVVNTNFVTDVRKLALGGLGPGGASGEEASDDVPIVLICRSGNRSAVACKALVDAGLQNVYNIEEGFEGSLDENHHRSTVGGWRFHGLPWEQC